MHKGIGRVFRNSITKRHLNHRVIDDNIKALGLRNPNIIRNPT